MRVLVACEFSGRVRDAFIAKGHDTWSADLLPSMRPGPHYQGDVREILSDSWDLMVAHPPCTYLSRVSGSLIYREPGRLDKWKLAAEFFAELLLDQPHIPMIAVENPTPLVILHDYLGRRYDQTVQPWWFGEPWSKGACLWLKGLPKLVATNVVIPQGSWISSSNRTVAGCARNTSERSLTFQGVADAMAEQWGSL